MNPLQRARQLYKEGAHAEAIAFITSDADLATRRPLVEEVAYNLRKTKGNAAAVEHLLEHLPDFPSMYPRWTRMMSHWSINALPDARAAEICKLGLAANTTHSQRIAMTGALFHRIYKLFVRVGDDDQAGSVLKDGCELGFHECIYLNTSKLDHQNPSRYTWEAYGRLVSAPELSGEIWAGIVSWICPQTAQKWLELLDAQQERLEQVAGFQRARAKAYQSCNRYEQAVNALMCALKSGASDVGTIWNEIVSNTLLILPTQENALQRLEAFSNAVIYNPSNRLSLEALKAELLRANPEANVLGELDCIQRSQDRIILTIFFELRAHEPLETLLKRYSSQFEAETILPAYRDCEALWNAYVKGAPLPAIALPDNNTVKIFIIKMMRGAKRVNIARNWAGDRALMKSTPINTKSLRQLHMTLAQEIDPHWAAYLDEAKYPNDQAKKTVLQRETECCFQSRILNSGQFSLPDLAGDGLDVGVVDSFYTNGRNVFTFAGASPFIFVTAGAGSRPFMLYYPDQNIIVDLGARLGHMLDDFHMNNLLSRYISRLAENTVAYNASRQTVQKRADISPAPRKITLNINTAENFAHHVWNFYTGLERQLRFGSMKNVGAIHFAGTEFFGALNEIFPEIAHFPMGTERIEGNVDPVPFDPDALLLTVGGYFISQPLQDRIARVCSAHVLTHTDAVARLEKIKASGSVVWFGLRTGDKSWLGQEDGLIKVIRYLQSEFDDVTCVLDAFSLPANQPTVPPVWQNAFNRLGELCERIIAAVPRPDDVINLTGVSLPETILIARETDAYVTPLGTTQHKVGWFSKGPGLVYISSAVGQLEVMRRPGTWESEGITLPDFLVAEREFAGERRDVNDRRAHLFNMELDANKICFWLKDKLAN
ncbi:MAG: hypothetical protein WD046_04085 [Paracoccaceae bacterium]